MPVNNNIICIVDYLLFCKYTLWNFAVIYWSLHVICNLIANNSTIKLRIVVAIQKILSSLLNVVIINNVIIWCNVCDEYRFNPVERCIVKAFLIIVSFLLLRSYNSFFQDFYLYVRTNSFHVCSLLLTLLFTLCFRIL